MAEYVEVMKQKKRMCSSTLCCECDIFHFSGEKVGSCPQFILNNPSKAEKIIMAWAAEHPEPVYPTWGEWFAERGDLIKLWRNIRVCSEHGTGVIGFLYTTIPADIAQKLEIEPKEAKA